LDPKYTRGHIRIAKCSLLIGDTGLANQALDQVQMLDPNYAIIKEEKILLEQLQNLLFDAKLAKSEGEHHKVENLKNYSFLKLKLIFL